MAARGENVQGYDVSRFVGEVKEDLLCAICQKVPKDPRLCQNEDHIFCLAHISRHLKNSQTCPVCSDPLTLETLRRPGGFLKNYLDDLKIKCDFHHDRGCPDVVRLENLPKHVTQCEFAPVMCGNEGCGMIVNKSKKENHEKNICEFRNVKYHDYKEMKKSQDEMNASQHEMKASYDEIKASQEEIKVSREEWKDEMNVELTEMKDEMAAIEGKQDQMQQSVDEMKEQVEKVMKLFNQALQTNNVNNIGAHVTTDPQVSTNSQDIIILGGRYGSEAEKVSNTVEKLNMDEGESTDLRRMATPRAASAACVFNGHVIITGGYDGLNGTDWIEILKITQHPSRWMSFGGKLPVRLSGHAAIIHQNKLYVIGGDNWNEQKISNIIYELDLAPPYAVKILARMPQVRRNHSAEIVNGKLFIFGGTTTGYSKDAIDSVAVYDFVKKEFKKCPSLPKAVCGMSTVRWGDKIIVVGGQDKNGQDLNDVIMYDTETGRSERLPSLKQRRYGPSAAILDDVIVVLGGWNWEKKYLNSVESLKIGNDSWKERSGMKQNRSFATAVVIPRI